MSDCRCEKVRKARQRVVEQLAEYRSCASDECLASLKGAIENWQHTVDAWNEAVGSVDPSKPGVN